MPKRCAFGCPPSTRTHHLFPNPKRFPETFKSWVALLGGKLECPANISNVTNICEATPETNIVRPSTSALVLGMDSDDSRDGNRKARSSSSSSSSSSSRRSRSRRSSSSDKSDVSKKHPKSPQSPHSNGPRSPSPESRSQSPPLGKCPRSPDNLSGAHSDINSPENSMPNSPAGPRSPDAPKSPSDGSNITSPDPQDQFLSAPRIGGDGPKTPQSPSNPEKSSPNSTDHKSRPTSPDSVSQVASPNSRNNDTHSRTSSPSPDRKSNRSSPPPPYKKNEWRRTTKGEQKMVPQMRSRSQSESSQSSRSSTYNKRTKDPATEEISDGEMESDQEDRKSRSKSVASGKPEGKDINICHEDLSDVSDLDSMGYDNAKDSKSRSQPASPDGKSDDNNGKKSASTQSSPRSHSGKIETQKLEKLPQEKTSNTEDGEEQLDFEAEEGECVEPKPKDQRNGDIITEEVEKEETKPSRRSRGSSLEEGEVSDEGERRPEESEPRPLCRFFSRGACTWGISCRHREPRPVCRFFSRGACVRGVSCRFLHPGVTDKGNYNMFDVIRGVPPGGSYPPPVRDTAPPESAWERGLRTAKEMLRIANKRKEQDMDFEEKKLHLSVGGVVHDPDAELAYAAAAVGASPPRAPEREPPPVHAHPDLYRYGPVGRVRYPRGNGEEREHYLEREPPYERERERERPYERERERPYERERVYERVPHYEERVPVHDELAFHKRRVRPSREVIVQRAENERREAREGREGREGRDGREGREGRREGRGDEWADPWMRAEAAARRRRPPSSDDSYSSSSSSNSSSRSSRSPGARRKRRASSSSRQRLSPSVIVRERRLAVARATAMNPPAPRRRAPSPPAARLAANPPAPTRHKDEVDPYGRKASGRNRDRRYSSSSGSESSSSSSESESESRSSSTSGSSGTKRARHARLLNAAARPRMNAKSNAVLAAAVSTVASKKEALNEKESSAKKRPATSPVSAAPPNKSVSRREELLKQLKAVEDAIARKRSKI